MISEVVAVDPASDLASRLTTCWLEVSNDGGAVGFPFPPVERSEVAAATADLVEDVNRGRAVLFVAGDAVAVRGWVAIYPNRSPLTAHWATLKRLQTHPAARGIGLARQLLDAVVAWAEAEGMEGLLITVRGGEGLEAFYERLGWKVCGRHEKALRITEGDDRDEVMMSLDLRGEFT